MNNSTKELHDFGWCHKSKEVQYSDVLTERYLCPVCVQMDGKFYFLAGFSDHEFFKAILKITDSSWMKITESPSSKTEIVISQENKL